MNQDLRKYDQFIEQCKLSIDDINARLNRFAKEHDELRQKPDVPADYNNFKSFTSGKVKEILDSLEVLAGQLKDMKGKIQEEASQNARETLERLDIRSSIKSIIDSFESHKNELNQRLTGLGNSISNVFNSVKDHSDKGIEKLKQEISVSPTSILETNKSILHKLEECKMDCSNAMLKLSNFETQFTLFQRKLENLDIRIKKFELEKQG